MGKRLRLPVLFLTGFVFLNFVSCGSIQAETPKAPEGSAAVETTGSQKQEIDPESWYSDAMDQIASGNTVEGMKKLAEIPSWKDAEVYLYGYSYLEYFIGEWEADLSSDFDKGTSVFPYEMLFTISDNDLWLDSEINGFQRMRYPVTIDYTIWKDNKTQTGTKEYEGYILFKMNDEDEEADVIIFGLETDGVWYNFTKESRDKARCSFSVSDKSGEYVQGSRNIFGCSRITAYQDAGITWDKHGDIYAYEEKDNKETHVSYQPENSNISNDPAVQKAMDYLAYAAFSRDGLIEQLEYEGFSHYEAQNAVDSLDTDWEEQALLKALQYLDYTAFSYSGLIEQLEYEGFSHSEAEYGADNCGADWNEQAVIKARQYLEYTSFSRSGLIDQLRYEGFTQSQAEYGVNRAY